MINKDFKEEHLIRLQGKDYLPVAPRVVIFRSEHPGFSIRTETKEVCGETYVYAVVANAEGYTLATAHKRVRKDGKGPASQWPLETAETGAIGRALALCGYGTLSGDLDEGDELADAPVERTESDSRGNRAKNQGAAISGPVDLGIYLEQISKAASLSDLKGVVNLVRDGMSKLPPESHKQLADAITAKKAELA
jgi:hypothetical protein